MRRKITVTTRLINDGEGERREKKVFDKAMKKKDQKNKGKCKNKIVKQ